MNRRYLDWIFGLSAIGVGLLSLGYLLKVALSARGDLPLHVDETFFAACAARGMLTDRWMLPGCHDNKGPVIYLVYRAVGVLASGSPYGIWLHKIAAAALLLITSALLGRVVLQLYGFRVAAIGFLICMVTVAANPEVLSLNTDLVATCFVVGAASLLMSSRRIGLPAFFVAGILISLAMLSKQTYAVFALAIMGCAWVRAANIPSRWQGGLKLLFAAAVGMLLPWIYFSLHFLLVGELDPFLASILLYPLTYGQVGDGSVLRSWAYRFNDFASVIERAPILSIGMAAALVASYRTGRHTVAIGTPSAPEVARVLLWFSLLALFFYGISPVLAFRTALPLIAFGSFLAAVGLAWVLSSLPLADPVPRRALAVIFSVLLLSGLLNVWTHNTPKRDGDQSFVIDSFPEGKGATAYVFGVWPQFYYFNRMYPASDVMYATGLSGGVSSVWDKSSQASGWVSRKMRDVRAANEVRLASDFAKTPPAYVVIGTTLPSRVDGAPLLSGVRALDRYVAQHCRFERHLSRPSLQSVKFTGLSLYACD